MVGGVVGVRIVWLRIEGWYVLVVLAFHVDVSRNCNSFHCTFVLLLPLTSFLFPLKSLLSDDDVFLTTMPLTIEDISVVLLLPKSKWQMLCCIMFYCFCFSMFYYYFMIFQNCWQIWGGYMMMRNEWTKLRL